MTEYKKGQGAQNNPHQRFEKLYHEKNDFTDTIDDGQNAVKFIDVFPKTIVNQVKSPDLSFNYSMNPYQGCEHGCSYCYARPTHEYWNYSAGIDFERVILIKRNAPELLEKFFHKRNYQPQPILLSGNTDCYQPYERKLEITREILKIFLKYKHPVIIITKNALIQRDLDILEQLNQYNLVKVNISVTTLDESLRRNLEPRTSTSDKRLETIEKLASLNIPVYGMIAPIIPGLNSDEILSIAKALSEKGAINFGTTMVRLNQTVFPVFKDWIEKAYPNKAKKVLNLIAEIHGGTVNDFRFNTRMKGEGNYAENIQNIINVARNKFFDTTKTSTLSIKHFNSNPQQTRLF